jgi:hypothetical protein
MAAQFATEMAATAIGATIGALILNSFNKTETTIPTAEAEEIISPVVEASLISPNCPMVPTIVSSSGDPIENKNIKISQFLQRDAPDSEFYLNITRIGDHQLLDKSNIDFDVDFDTIIKYFADEELCPLRMAKLIEIICYFIDGYDQDIISESNRVKMRPHIPKIITIFKKYKNELNIAFICFRFIRLQCRTSDDNRKLFISIIQPDNELLTKMMPQNMRGNNLINIIESLLEDTFIIEEGLFAIGNIARDKTLSSNFYLYIDKLIDIIKKYRDNSQIVEGSISVLVKISKCTANMIKLGEHIPFIISIMEQYQNNFNIIKNILELLFHFSQTEKNKTIICMTTNFNAILSASDTHIDKPIIIQRLTSLVLRCMTAKQIIDNGAAILDYTSMLHAKIVLSILKSKHFDTILSAKITKRIEKELAEKLKLEKELAEKLKLEKELAEKLKLEKELKTVANQLSNAEQQSNAYAMATMQMENEALKEEVKKLKEYIRNSNI